MHSESREAQRTRLRSLRRGIDARGRLAAGAAIAQQLRPLLRGYVAGYWAVDGEVPLHALLSGPRDFVYCLPVLQPGKTLRFAPWRAGDALVQNRHGIPEPDLAAESLLDPAALDVVLLPLLGFDRRGNRLGTGGGYYDRSFAFLRALADGAPRPRLVGIAHALQELPAIAAEAWDVPLDLVVTERETIDCARNTRQP
jgi:5-formyltetrahydrofolate cyclo-ligase